MEQWRETTLGELLNVKHGYPFLGEHFAEAGTHIVLTPGNFEERGGFRSKGEKEKWYTGPIPPEYVLRRGDVLVAMTEQAEGLLGSSIIVPKDDLYLHNQRLGLVQVREADLGFVYHLFNAPSVRQQIRATASGTKVRHTSPSRIAAVRVRVPDIKEQRRIAGILSAYDDLIENCERRIRVLDEMARSLYREWFVHFRYPGHERMSLAASSLGRTPAGWSIESLGQLAQVQKGLSYKGEGLTDEGVPMVNLKCILAGGVFRRNGVKPYSGEFKDRHRVFSGDLVFANTDLTQAGGIIGSITRVPRHGFAEGGIASHHVSIVRPRDPEIRVWLLFALRDDLFRNFARGHASGTTVLGFRTEDAEAYELLVPPRALRNDFAARVAPMLDAAEVLEDRLEVLHQTRDLLLPRLLSGQLTAEDAA